MHSSIRGDRTDPWRIYASAHTHAFAFAYILIHSWELISWEVDLWELTSWELTSWELTSWELTAWELISWEDTNTLHIMHIRVRAARRDSAFEELLLGKASHLTALRA